MQHHWSDHLTNQRWLDCEGKGLDDELCVRERSKGDIETQSTSMFSILNMNIIIIIVKRKQQSTTLKMEKERANTELKLMTNRVL